MFQGYSGETVDFLWGIRFNNERSWFQEHKEMYLTHLQRPTAELAREVYDRFLEKYPKEPVNLHISRIYRDARRLHGRGPYKDYLWFSLRVEHGFQSHHPELWFDISPEGWTCGCGFWAATPTMMAAMRRYMDESPEKMRKLVRTFNQQDVFAVGGTDYARPKMNPEDELAPWYNKKSILLSRSGTVDEIACSHALVDVVAESFFFLKPYYDFFESFCHGGLEDLK
ncbi:MAG: DUF2461 domain-containing protein [Oscillospiraceae bacterium]|nr:DUF2461 domain-containing protein [Oscillospiraceae bacterium]